MKLKEWKNLVNKSRKLFKILKAKRQYDKIWTLIYFNDNSKL